MPRFGERRLDDERLVEVAGKWTGHVPARGLRAGSRLRLHLQPVRVVTGRTTSTLWRTEGTPGDLTEVALFTGTAIRDVEPAGNHRLFLLVGTGADDADLYVTDGTPGGETRLRTLHLPGEMVGLGRTLLFSADGPGGEGEELWRSNGTPEGTVLVEDILPGPGGSRPHFLTVMEGVLYFVANDGTHGDEPWRSTGRASGTRLLKDVQPGPLGSTPLDLTAIQGTLFFTAETSGHGREPWLSQGTPESTRQVEDIAPGPASSVGLGRFTRSGWDVFFFADDGRTGLELWALPFRPADRCHDPRR
ncbi:ELWxxDGT repeat protein [Archangium lansingense]|uniref:ELWxxDGT repeat protein n=1 Tax=Archangium lansingense TaxID=2995310 RepID=A0ABT4AHW1_9BACT|nr:ELWxxDGT repeat protein [Archangium lansinium]MCY1080467.1 hypothetical protein [Archangium lansinium]